MSVPVGKHISMAPAILPSGGLRPVMFGVALALLIAPNSALILCFRMTGSAGSSWFTDAFLTIVTVAAGLLCFRRDVILLPIDHLFLALVLCIPLSSAFHGRTSDAKEYELLAVSLAAYPACRLISRAVRRGGRAGLVCLALFAGARPTHRGRVSGIQRHTVRPRPASGCNTGASQSGSLAKSLCSAMAPD